MRKILLQQLDDKIKKFNNIKKYNIPKSGWIYNIRMAINMSLSQLGKKLKMTPQGIRELEQRELNKSITISSLEKIARALDMNFIYGFIPKEGSIKKKLDNRIKKKAIDIVSRTSRMMELEDQKNKQKRINSAIQEKIIEFNHKIPKHLWD
ncbi:MAG: mobile mystery protein A [Bacteroidetes bacterium]|nr:mobile mystery protein A [Bacteroidota bacterium]